MRDTAEAYTTLACLARRYKLSLNSLEKAAEHARNDLESDMLLLDVNMKDQECQCSESDEPQSGISMGSESLQFRQKLPL